MSTHSTHRHTLKLSRTDVLPRTRSRLRDGARRKMVDCLTTQCFRFCSVMPEKLPFSPLKICQSGTVHAVLVSPGWTVPSDSNLGEGSAVTKTRRKKGGTADSTLRGRKKRYVFVKNKHVWCLSGALQQKGKKKCLFFLLLFKLVAQKQQITFTSHLLAPCTWVRIL